METERKCISSFDCIMICSVIALSLTKKNVKKLSYRYNLVPKQKHFDYSYAYYCLHQQAHSADSPVVKALNARLDRQHAVYIEQLKNIESGDVATLKRFVNEGMNVSPGAVLWALLTDGRDELQSQGVYFAHDLVFRQLRNVFHGCDFESAECEGDDIIKEVDSTLRKENEVLRDELNTMRATLDGAEQTVEQLKKLNERLDERIAELEERPNRESRLLRENRILEYRLGKLERKSDDAESSYALPACLVDLSELNGAAGEVPVSELKCMVKRENASSISEPPCLKNGDCPLEALRIAVVGGLDRLEPRYRDIVERLGGEMLFHTGHCRSGTHTLKNMVCSSDIVVFITSVNSHNAMWVVKAECRKNGKKFTVLKQTSPDALEKTLLAEAAG